MKAEVARLPELLLEQYVLGELSAAERVKVEADLEASPDLRARLEEIRRSDEAILAEAPSAEIAASIRRRALAESQGKRKSRVLRPSTLIALPAAAAALLLVGFLFARDAVFPSSGDLTRAKGGAPGLSLYRKAASGPEPLRDGSTAAAGDIVQIRYAAGNARYGAIFSLDGRGTITFHLPPLFSGAGGKAPEIDARGSDLPAAYELDDAPAFERFFFVSSREAFDLSVVLQAARELEIGGSRADIGSLVLPPGIEARSVILRKIEESR